MHQGARHLENLLQGWVPPSTAGSWNAVAYVEEGKDYGLIPLDNAESLSYDYYQEYKRRWQEFELLLSDYNKEASRHNHEVAGKIYTIGSPEWERIKDWEASLESQKKKLNQLRDKTGFSIQFIGRRPTGAEIKYASLGEIDSLIRETAFEEGATLFTADKVQARVAEAKGIRLIFAEIEVNLGGSHGVDVTGGMLSKVREMVSLVAEGVTHRVHFISGRRTGALTRVLLDTDTNEGTVIVP